MFLFVYCTGWSKDLGPNKIKTQIFTDRFRTASVLKVYILDKVPMFLFVCVYSFYLTGDFNVVFISLNKLILFSIIKWFARINNFSFLSLTSRECLRLFSFLLTSCPNSFRTEKENMNTNY